MRRLEYDIYAPRAVPPPFRVLGSGGTSYLTPAPSPPLAPEPYKVAPATSASSRAHRRSSFVIIAETRPATPCSRSPSPSLATGRISPFRGRGFKGPLPHAQSRPQSPTNDRRKHSRTERRASVSAQNSPKRSLIPQPTRRRSISLSKTETGRSSPKYGRRAGSRTHLEVTANVAPGRKASLRPPGLSPIQGTPTKPPEKKNVAPGRFNLADKKSSPVKSKRISLLPPRSVPKSRRASTEKSPSKEVPSSPSKIPVKRGSISNKPGSKVAQTTRRSSISKTTKPEENAETSHGSNEKSGRKTEKQGSDSAKKSNENSPKVAEISKPGPDSSGKNTEETTKSSKHEEDVGPSLIDLLKQSSGASGTSSVVNTTTVTAAQPLQIDASVLLENDTNREKNNQPKPRTTNSAKKNGQTRPSAGQATSSAPEQVQAQNGTSKTSNGNESNGETCMTNNHDKTQSSPKSGIENQTPMRMGHSKTGSSSQTTKSVSKTNGVNGDNSQSVDVKSQPGAVNSSNPNDQRNSNTLQRNGTTSVQLSNTLEQPTAALDQTGVPKAVPNIPLKTVLRTGDSVLEGRGTSAISAGNMASSNSSDSRNLTSLMNAANGVSSAVNGFEVNGATGVQNQGSDLSIKSSTGVSTGSVGSVRSADTGVSVNTVRGVSSAREKTGMHLVKRPQEIETLSGNVVQIDRNGEPALLAPEREEELQPPEKVGCWKKVVGRWCGCCSTMRCLACRRGSKNHPWATRPPVPPTIDEAPAGRWSKLKSACRCWRWPQCKCCAHGSRVAPAESATCCPPERRCSALCQRLFSRCKCKRPDVQRTRSMHAKQSLTSVAAPPLSEEPKSKLPDVLVEHNSVMRGAIPCLPVPLAWFCLVWNVLLPGSGTFWSGLFNLCVGQPRFSAVASARSRIGAFIVNLIVGVGQMFTVLFCLVGWGWSIWWGVTMVRLAKKYRRFKASEAANGDVEARTAEPGSLPPGVPSQALRGIERAR